MRTRRIYWVLFALLMLVILPFWGDQATVYASPQEQEICYSVYDWQELEMGAFVLVFPIQQIELAQQIFGRFPGEFETLMENYTQAFGVELILPVTIRIYPTFADYYCVNPLAALVGEDFVHSNVGQREIALFGKVVQDNSDVWEELVMTALQHELAVLFAEEISGGYAPQGLLKGLGGYAENPQVTFSERFEAAGSPHAPVIGWQMLWDEEAELINEEAMLEAASVAAYLIDVHGWENFIDFLNQIKVSQGYRQAITDVYGVNLQGLQAHWSNYFPVYVDQRWQANIFHSYDLDAFRQLLSSGAYSDSIPGLTEAISLIAIFGDQDQLQAAQDLLANAEIGARAGELTLQSRQALLSGKYVESFTAAEEALDLYSQLNDTRRVNELEIYMSVSKEVLDLRADLEEISEQGIGINPFRSQNVFEKGQRLLELGDSEGVNQAELILLLLGASRNTFFQLLIAVFVLISFGLIIRQILNLRKPKPPEADLL